MNLFHRKFYGFVILWSVVISACLGQAQVGRAGINGTVTEFVVPSSEKFLCGG
jgi:hypothetical protein